jgi:hypothetical protein
MKGECGLEHTGVVDENKQLTRVYGTSFPKKQKN